MSNPHVSDYDGYVKIEVDPRPLKRVFEGHTALIGRMQRSDYTWASRKSPISMNGGSTSVSVRSTPMAPTSLPTEKRPPMRKRHKTDERSLVTRAAVSIESLAW